MYKRFVTITTQPGLTVIGVTARVSNARLDLIGELWGRFMREGVLEKIPNKTDNRIRAVYTEYESDEHGAFTLVIGASVSDAAVTPPGMRTVHAAPGRYALFTSRKGAAEQVVPETWAEVWRQPSSGEYSRSFLADYEVYNGEDPAQATVEILIGLR